jgi:pimeloyl-ACP methyl ester carboxylesterase
MKNHQCYRAPMQGVARSKSAELAYSIEGAGAETVLLVMGLGGRAADWGTAFPGALATRYRVVRFDNRGVGKSPKAAAGYSLSDLADDAVAVLDAVGAAKAHVIGISMGGMIAQLVALEHPERVDKLVLMATHAGGSSVEQMHPDAMALFDPTSLFGQPDPDAQIRRTLGVITAPGFVDRSPAAVDEMLAAARKEPTHPAAFIAQFQALMASDRSGRVKTIAVPTLVIHGDEDKLIRPSNGKFLAEQIPGARLAMLADCGHIPMYEKPDELNALVLEFLATPRSHR